MANNDTPVTAEDLAKRFESHGHVTTAAPPADSTDEETPDGEDLPEEGGQEEVEEGQETAEEGAEEGGEESVDAGESEEGEAEEGEKDTRAKDDKRMSVGQRIAWLTKTRREAERKAAEYEQRLRELEAKTKQPAEEQPKSDLTESEKSDTKEGPPKPEDFDYGELDPRYVEALVAHQTRATLAEFQKEQAETARKKAAEQQAQEFLQKYEQRVAEGAAEFDDFEDVVVKRAERGEYPLSQTVAELAVGSEVGHKVMYHLAKNLDEAKKIDSLDPVQQAVAFGRLEARFSSGKDAPKTTRAPKAPPPTQQARGSGGKFQVSPDTQDFTAFKKAMNAKDK